MSYSDDQMRERLRRTPPSKIGMSKNEMAGQYRILDQIVQGNESRVRAGAKEEEEKQRVILAEGLKYLDKKPGRDQKDADRKMDAVIGHFS